MQHIDVRAQLHRIDGPVGIGVKSRDDFKHPTSYPFERFGLGRGLAQLHVVEC